MILLNSEKKCIYMYRGRRAAHAQNIFPNRVTSGHVTDVTSGHVTSGSTTAQHHRKCDLSCAHILLSENQKLCINEILRA